MTFRELTQFKEKLASIKPQPRCKTCFHKVKTLNKQSRKPNVDEIQVELIDKDADGRDDDDWNESDGMSTSILSEPEEKDDLARLIRNEPKLQKNTETI